MMNSKMMPFGVQMCLQLTNSTGMIDIQQIFILHKTRQPAHTVIVTGRQTQRDYIVSVFIQQEHKSVFIQQEPKSVFLQQERHRPTAAK
jgi:hypothetical protein